MDATESKTIEQVITLASQLIDKTVHRQTIDRLIEKHNIQHTIEARTPTQMGGSIHLINAYDTELILCIIEGRQLVSKQISMQLILDCRDQNISQADIARATGLHESRVSRNTNPNLPKYTFNVGQVATIEAMIG